MRFPRQHHLLALLLASAAVVVAGSLFAWAGESRTLPSAQTVRIYYDEINDLDQLAAYDLFEANNLQQRYVLAAVSGDELQTLRRAGWNVVPDWLAPQALENERYYDGYRTVDELYAEMARLAGQYPTISEVVPYGGSYCAAQGGCVTPGGERTAGYNLLAMRVTNEHVPGASRLNGSAVERGDKPLFFILSNIHAREQTTPEIAMRWLDLLLEQYGRDPDVTWLVDWHEMWIIPTANPDGHWITELGAAPPYSGTPMMHRKNFDVDADGDGAGDCDVWPSLTYSQFGVDLNRNHSFSWLRPGSEVSACSPTYSGPTAASEPEVAALQDLVRGLFADRRGPNLDDAAAADTSGMLFSLHNYSELILRPWGFSRESAPDEEGLKAIGDKLATFNDYLSCRAPECLYSAHGTTDDWAYGELGMAAFTFEIGAFDQGFSPPYSVIDEEQWPENRDAFLYAARIARAPYQLIKGPDVSRLAVVTTGAVTEISVNAEIDDRDHGGQTIAGAEYSIDKPFWDSEAEVLPMNFAGETLSQPVAEFVAALDLTSLSPGKHVIFVRGRDIEHNRGVTRSAYFDVLDTGQSAYTLRYIPIAVGK